MEGWMDGLGRNVKKRNNANKQANFFFCEITACCNWIMRNGVSVHKAQHK
jgi:hypothetical protein